MSVQFLGNIRISKMADLRVLLPTTWTGSLTKEFPTADHWNAGPRSLCWIRLISFCTVSKVKGWGCCLLGSYWWRRRNKRYSITFWNNYLKKILFGSQHCVLISAQILSVQTSIYLKYLIYPQIVARDEPVNSAKKCLLVMYFGKALVLVLSSVYFLLVMYCSLWVYCKQLWSPSSRASSEISRKIRSKK